MKRLEAVTGWELRSPGGKAVFELRRPVVPWPVDTPEGRYYAELDYEAPVTREGQLIFFAQFLHTGGRWERFLRGCPVRYEGNRGSQVFDVTGTVALSILCGHWCYAHINESGVTPSTRRCLG